MKRADFVSSRTPSGCALCGISKARHVDRWNEEFGWHYEWVMPDDATILQRMKRRREHPRRWLPSHDIRYREYRKWRLG